MKLSFRQGIARYQTDVLSTPNFLQRSSGAGNFIDLVVAPDPTVVVFAHKTADYLVEEVRTVDKAWGPLTGTATQYLFWDINLATGVLTRGITIRPPMYTGTEPPSPVQDQHWFDTTRTTMFVYSGSKWIEKVRVFAGYVTSGSIIHPYPLGTQANIIGSYQAGSIVLDSYNKPLRQSDGTFVTTVSSLIIVNNAGTSVQFENEVLSGMAAEPLPKFSLVQIRPNRLLVLNRSSDPMSRIAGVVLEDLYTNEAGTLIPEGLIRNEAWHFDDSVVNRPIFSGLNGEITTIPPTSGVLQIAGFVYDKDSVYIHVHAAIVLDDMTGEPPPNPPLDAAPIANFYANPRAGTAPLRVSFTQTTANNPTSFAWDFENKGVIDSTALNPTYTYQRAGTYDVRLSTSNAFGQDEELKIAYIQVLPPAAGPPGLYTNLGIMLGGPFQALQGQTFKVSVNVSNDGYQAATQLVRTLKIPDFNGVQIQVLNLPPETEVKHEFGVTIIELPIIPVLASGHTTGPTNITVVAPASSGAVIINGTVDSPETDPTAGDNVSTIEVEVKP